MNCVEEAERLVILQIQKWHKGELSSAELLNWSQEFYNSFIFKQKYEKDDYGKEKKRHKKLHTILYWYLSSLNCRFIEREHGPILIEGLSQTDFFPDVSHYKMAHTDHVFVRERAKRLREDPFYKKYSKLLLEPNIEEAFSDIKFMNVAFRKLLKYQMVDYNQFLKHPSLQGKGFRFGTELFLRNHTCKETEHSFNGFNEATNFPDLKAYYFPFNFSVSFRKKTCVISIGTAYLKTEENKMVLENSTAETCPYQINLNYLRFESFLTNKYYTYLTKPKLKKNIFHKGFWRYWQ